MKKIFTTQLIVPCYVQKVSQYQWKSTDLTKHPLFLYNSVYSSRLMP